MLRSTATPDPRKQATMPDENPMLLTAHLGVGVWRCASRRAAKTALAAVGLRLFKA
jgi:hypothetical protein